MTLGRRRFAGLALPLLAAACSSPDPVYYTVATRPGPTFPAGPKIVMLKDIGLASYLDRREIVRSSEGYKLDVMSNDWWGESLGGMLGRVLVVELVPAPARQHDLCAKAAPSRRIPTPSSASTSSVSMPTGRHAHPARPGRRRIQPAAALGVAHLHDLQAPADTGHARPGGGDQRRRGRARRRHRGAAAGLDATALLRAGDAPLAWCGLHERRFRLADAPPDRPPSP